MAQEFLHNKGNLGNCCFDKCLLTAPHGIFLYPLLLGFHLQIVYRKVGNVQIGADKLKERCQ